MKALIMKQQGQHFLFPRIFVDAVDIPDDNKLQGYYDAIGCDCITMVDVEIDGHEYSIVADDEGLFASPVVPTLHINDDCVLFGSLVFVKIDYNTGESVSLNHDDAERIMKYIKSREQALRDFIKLYCEKHLARA